MKKNPEDFKLLTTYQPWIHQKEKQTKAAPFEFDVCDHSAAEIKECKCWYSLKRDDQPPLTSLYNNVVCYYD